MIEVEGVHSSSIGRLIEKEFIIVWNEAKSINPETVWIRKNPANKANEDDAQTALFNDGIFPVESGW